MDIKPGVLMWGGHEGWFDGTTFPVAAIDKWARDFGWENQHHLLWINFGQIEPRGVNRVVKLAKRIIDGGGWTQVIIAGTPPELATVPLDRTSGWNRIPVYPFHKPVSNDRYANEYFIPALRAFHKGVGLERVSFNVWDEPNFWNWRNSDAEFYALYDAVQKAVQKWQRGNVKVTIGGLQLANIDNAKGSAPNDPPYIRTPIETWLNRFLELANSKGWQIDFMDFFKYGFVIPPNDVITCLLEMENIFDQHGRGDVEFVFNAISHAGRRDWSDIHPDESESALFTLMLTKMLHDHTRVNRGGFDFLEDSSRQEMNGLLEYETLRERPRWEAVRKILQWQG